MSLEDEYKEIQNKLDQAGKLLKEAARLAKNMDHQDGSPVRHLVELTGYSHCNTEYWDGFSEKLMENPLLNVSELFHGLDEGGWSTSSMSC